MVQGRLCTAWHVKQFSKLQGPWEGLPHRGWIRSVGVLCLPWQGGVGTQASHVGMMWLLDVC